MFVKNGGGVPEYALSRADTHTHVDLELNPRVKNAEPKINILSTLTKLLHRVRPFGPAASFFF